jgi:hypothetical protein
MTFLTSFPLYTALMGPAAVQSRDDKYSFTHTLPDKIEQDFGVIAGCVPLDPSSWLVMSEPNDGRLTVGSTKLGGMRDHTVVTASHDTILFHPITAAQTLHFLNHGKFIPAFP